MSFTCGDCGYLAPYEERNYCIGKFCNNPEICNDCWEDAEFEAEHNDVQFATCKNCQYDEDMDESDEDSDSDLEGI
jgi:hypothetical protein